MQRASHASRQAFLREGRIIGVPAAEVVVTAQDLRRLLKSQAPALSDLPIELAHAGWDNFMFRIGKEHVARLPRRILAVPLIEHEQRWLPSLAARLPIKIPAPSHHGVPGEGYPWHWSVYPWIEGTGADLAPPLPSEFSPLVEFLKALHGKAPADAPRNPFRGVPLGERAAKFAQAAERLAPTGLITRRHQDIFERALTAPMDCDGLWIHGDLHPANMLTVGGRIVGIIDWGDVAQGDPATDLSSFFMLFDAGVCERALAAYGASPALADRSRGWAVLLAAIFTDAGRRGDARMGPIGERVLKQLDS